MSYKIYDMNAQEPAKSSPLAPAQVRAARALLAWSQQDLANSAGIGTSTVADFERGRRVPVPQNAQAIRAAFERASVSFPPGGAVVGREPPRFADAARSGAPIRYVNGTDLAQWAERRVAQAMVPTLISKLVRASAADSLHFPSDEAVQLRGWDGTTYSRAGSEYVPKGHSGWEISTQREGIPGKATEDYEKRSRDPLGLSPAESTFIFVTPRSWPEKEKWVHERCAEGLWKEIRVYDGTDLVHWIELYPTVGVWLAAELEKHPSGVRQLKEVWEEWSLATQPALGEDLILSDRDEDSAAILRWLRAEASAMAVQAESAEEVAAFVYAAIKQLPPEVAEHYFARSLVVADSEAARRLGGSSTPLLIAILDPETGVPEAIAQKGHHVLAALGQEPGSVRVGRKLRRPSREGIEVALADAGVPDIESKRLARDASRSLAILRRCMPASAFRMPKWALGTISRPLLAALLAGMWDDGCAADKLVMSRLSEMPYDAFTASITPFVGDFDSPLRKVGPTWKVASPRDAWFLLAGNLTSADIDRFQAATIDVFSTADPRYQLTTDDRWSASILGMKPVYSDALRHGMGETLILLALFGDQVTTVQHAARYVDVVVRKLLRQADKERWWSLSCDFQLLAEASPEEFLSAIDDSLDNDDPPIAALFGSDKSPLFGTSEHLSALLWALESLAWAPQHLLQVSLILAGLDQLDPGGRYLNRPAESLRTVFLLWDPQTNTSSKQRFKVIDRIRKHYPDTAWKLMLGILPGSHDSFVPTARTRWRNFSINVREPVTLGLLSRDGLAVVDRLLEDVGLDAGRWVALLDRWSDLWTGREKAVQLLEEIAKGRAGKKDRELLRHKLRRVLHHNRSAKDASWAVSEADLAELDNIYQLLTPEDVIERISWLFDKDVTLPEPSRDWGNDQKRIEAERREGVRRVFEENGVDRVFDLARVVAEPICLGEAIVLSGIPQDACHQILKETLGSEDQNEQLLGRSMVETLLDIGAQEGAEGLFEQAVREGWGDQAVLNILRSLPSSELAHKLVQRTGSACQAEYWLRVSVVSTKGEFSDPSYAVDRLIEAGRARDAVHFIDRQAGRGCRFSSELLVRALMEASRQPIQGNVNCVADTTFQYSAVEIFKQLDEAGDIIPERVAELEWLYLAVFESSDRPPKVILAELASKPDLFVQVLSAVYKPGAESAIVDSRPESEDRARSIARQAYRLLHMWDVIPGSGADGSIDGAKLESWVKEARELAHRRGRRERADQEIGRVLSASAVDADGRWPVLPIRELVETMRSRELEAGFVIGKINRRGGTYRAASDGGRPERCLADQYRQWSQAVESEWLRTSRMLGELAKYYEDQAKDFDADAELLIWR